MKVLVTGGTGSIGSAVVEVLLQRRHEVFEKARMQLGWCPVYDDVFSEIS